MVNGRTGILQVDNLSVAYLSHGRVTPAVRNVTFTIDAGQTLGIVGESGCGKSTLALAIMGYLGINGRIMSGRILFEGHDLRKKTRRELRSVLGTRIAMVYQDPQGALNPCLRVGDQIAEVLTVHKHLSPRVAMHQAQSLLEMVHMPDPLRVAQSYPHQLSGGMRQRVLIAMALSCDPTLLIMDEPTTGLDVTTEARILDLVSELKARLRSSILYITHNLGVVARVCDTVAVMYAGEIVELNSVEGIFSRQGHPYTQDLLSCVPRLGMRHKHVHKLPSIPGQVPRAEALLGKGCAYFPRCSHASAKCVRNEPVLRQLEPNHYSVCPLWSELSPKVSTSEGTDIGKTPDDSIDNRLLSVKGLVKNYDERQPKYLFFGPMVGHRIRAVSDLSFELGANETLALVGESGCGKTTLGQCVIGLVEPTSGQITLHENILAASASSRTAETRRFMQIVFQNPDSSLNPQHTVEEIVGRPLRLFMGMRGEELRKRTLRLLDMVKLDASYLQRKPAELSGGEKQRIAIARAFASGPKVVICDEAVSSLDVSVQASILNLLVQLQREHGTSYLFISHDLSVVQYVADRICVMYLGQFVELGSVDQVFAPPYHPYTEALLSAIPLPSVGVQRANIRLEGPVPSPAKLPPGCPFHTRCPRMLGEVCMTIEPPWQDDGNRHLIRCHIPLAQLRLVSPVWIS